MIHVRELDLLRAEVKQKLGLSLICICPQDRYNIELTFGEKDY